MAKISRRSGMIRGRIGDDVYKVAKGGIQSIYKYKPRSVPPSEKEKESVEKLSRIGERFGLLPDGLKGQWNIAAKHFSAPNFKCEQKQDVQKSYAGLKIIHHIHSYNGASFYQTCNSWAIKAHMPAPRDYPPMLGIGYPIMPRIIDWAWEKPKVVVKLVIPYQPYYQSQDAELNVILRCAFSGGVKYRAVIVNGEKKWKMIRQLRVQDQEVAWLTITKTPCEVELAFDKMHVGVLLGSKDVTLPELGKGVLTICANLIGSVNSLWSKEFNGDDFIGEKRCGALISLNSVPIQLSINSEGVPTQLKESGDFFKSLNQKIQKLE